MADVHHGIKAASSNPNRDPAKMLEEIEEENGIAEQRFQEFDAS